MLAPRDPVVDKPDTVHDPRFPVHARVHVKTGPVGDGQSPRAYTSNHLDLSTGIRLHDNVFQGWLVSRRARNA